MGAEGRGRREDKETRRWEANVEALREAIHLLLADRALREKFRDNTARVKWEFSWDEPIEQLVGLYENIVNGQQLSVVSQKEKERSRAGDKTL